MQTWSEVAAEASFPAPTSIPSDWLVFNVYTLLMFWLSLFGLQAGKKFR